MREFRNPANGHVESVSDLAPVWILLFGAIYLLFAGLWGHALICFGAYIVAGAAGGGPAVVLLWFPLTIGYALAVRSLLVNKYLHAGWQEVRGDMPTPTNYLEPKYDREAVLTMQQARNAPATKKCPYCAEEVKVEAIKCKHCQSELPATVSAN